LTFAAVDGHEFFASRHRHGEGCLQRRVPVQGGTVTEYGITRYRDATQNRRTQLERIILCAGLKPWPQLFQNLPSTRAKPSWTSCFPCTWSANGSATPNPSRPSITFESPMPAMRRRRNARRCAVQNPVQ
jgi:hypothetical protein